MEFFQEIDLKNISCLAINMNHENFMGKYIIEDEKAEILLRKHLFEFIKNNTKEYNKLKYEDFLARSKVKMDFIQKNILRQIQVNPLRTPIYDFEG